MKKSKVTIKDPKGISLDRYAGQWAALADGKVVGHHRSLQALMKKVKNSSNPRAKPSVLLVPGKNEGPYII